MQLNICTSKSQKIQADLNKYDNKNTAKPKKIYIRIYSLHLLNTLNS
ncbi:hypothetical protein bcCo53_001732 (plasmid) [Borrelia coriaceae]|nr:hypothetical protein [Borrelia coriaceae]UPA17523.1 hypothetical protein bcCo53_001732 [Borrelia coriaceae]